MVALGTFFIILFGLGIFRYSQTRGGPGRTPDDVRSRRLRSATDIRGALAVQAALNDVRSAPPRARPSTNATPTRGPVVATPPANETANADHHQPSPAPSGLPSPKPSGLPGPTPSGLPSPLWPPGPNIFNAFGTLSTVAPLGAFLQALVDGWPAEVVVVHGQTSTSVCGEGRTCWPSYLAGWLDSIAGTPTPVRSILLRDIPTASLAPQLLGRARNCTKLLLLDLTTSDFNPLALDKLLHLLVQVH